MSHLAESEAGTDVHELALQPLRSYHVLHVLELKVASMYWEGHHPANFVRQADNLLTNGHIMRQSRAAVPNVRLHFFQPALLGQRIARGQRRFVRHERQSREE